SAAKGVWSWFEDTRQRLPPNADVYRHHGPSIMLSEPLVVGLCYEHFANTYMRESHRIKIDRSFRSKSPDYSSAGHPGGEGFYTIRIWTGTASYMYVVDCFGEPIDHLMLRGREMKQLI